MQTSSIYMVGALLVLAFTGSWHCGLMCGPIACGILKKKKIFDYHAGRFLSYVGGGFLFGYLGNTITWTQSPIVKVVLSLFLSSFFIFTWLPMSKFDFGANVLLKYVLKQEPSAFIFGFFSVLLPCGWLWTFFAGAAASGNPWTGAFVTFVLWMSSLPALSLIPQILKLQMRDLTDKRTLIVRGVLTFAGIYAIWGHFFLLSPIF
jgi:uncharacterized protein